ncbi:cyanophycin synthetase [Plantactinospora veratri]|uniref:Cyanophycin synthetase n=1 Tax=Plantactinospora veratri TaxID=1436122 RepID=A0ABU7SGH2_9ACTN
MRRLRGPNVYLDRPVQVARVRLGRLTERESREFPGFTDRLLDALPGLAEHHCAAGAPGGFVDRLRGGTYFGHVTEHVAIELSELIGRSAPFGRTVYAGSAGQYDIVTECPAFEPADSTVPGELVELAVTLVEELLAGSRVRPGPRLRALRDRHADEMPGPSTASIIAAALRRGIPVERVDPLSLLQLGQGRHRRQAWAAMSDRTSATGVEIAGDKELSRRLLARSGIPVPAGGAAGTPAEALELLADLGGPVVLKSRNGHQGEHVHLGLWTPEDVRAAFAAAGGDVVVERQVDGDDYRVLVVAGRVVAAAERVPAHVVGDGRHSVRELIDLCNAHPDRGNGHNNVLTRLRVDDVVTGLLARQGWHLEAVPESGRRVWLRQTANLSTGGSSVDVTDRLHPDVVRLCERVAAIVGLDIAGIDLRLPDIAAPVPPVGDGGTGAVIEVNAVPGLRMHLAPVRGRPRDVGGAIVDALFPDGSDGRVPTIAVTGTNGKTTVSRLAAHLLAGAGLRVGLTCTDGVYLDGRLVQRADASGPRSAQAVLGDPTVEAAVLETARGGILRQGLGYDWTDVGVLTNVTADHLGQDGLTSVEDILHVKALVAERVRDGGTLVLNADDPLVAGLLGRARVRAPHKRLLWFSLGRDNPLVSRHVAAGGTAYVADDGWLVEVTGGRRLPLIPAAALPGAFGGAAEHVVANALAASAAVRALDLSPAVLARQLRALDPATVNPGRGLLLRLGDVHLCVDYAHNPVAIAAVTRTLHRLWGRPRCVAALTLPGDRRDDLLVESAAVVADGYDRVVLYPDADLRGRAPGEVPRLLCRELVLRSPGVRCELAGDAAEALQVALDLAGPGDVVLVVYEKLEPVLALLRSMGAVPAAHPVPAVGADVTAVSLSDGRVELTPVAGRTAGT